MFIDFSFKNVYLVARAYELGSISRVYNLDSVADGREINEDAPPFRIVNILARANKRNVSVVIASFSPTVIVRGRSR